MSAFDPKRTFMIVVTRNDRFAEILLGDNGATNARFALVSNGNLNAAPAHPIVCV
jgi:glucokinase